MPSTDADLYELARLAGVKASDAMLGAIVSMLRAGTSVDGVIAFLHAAADAKDASDADGTLPPPR